MHALEYTETAAVPVVVPTLQKRKVKHRITPTGFRRFFLFGQWVNSVVTEFYTSQN